MKALKPLHRWLRGAAIGCGALVLSTIAISASDVTRDVHSLLTGAVIDSAAPCGSGATLERFGPYALCVDSYEAAAGNGCSYRDPSNELETTVNLSETACQAVSEPNLLPWRFVTYNQAQVLCARSDKRLPTAAEWYRIALPLSQANTCVLRASGPAQTGSAKCITPSGIHDLVGNVWEWMSDTVVDGRIVDRYVPQSGYVDLVDDSGVVLRTRSTPTENFAHDYAWTEQTGVRGFLRGGYFQSGEDGGVYAQNLSIPLDFQSVGVGFRCVKDVE